MVATVPVLFLVTAGVFMLIHLTPGDPIDVMMAESVDAGVKEHPPARAGPRPAAGPAVRALDGADPPRGPRPVHPQPRAGHRERRPPHPAQPPARRARHGHLAGGGVSRRHRSPPRGATRRWTARAASFALFGICMPNFLLAAAPDLLLRASRCAGCPSPATRIPSRSRWPGSARWPCPRSRWGWPWPR